MAPTVQERRLGYRIPHWDDVPESNIRLDNIFNIRCGDRPLFVLLQLANEFLLVTFGLHIAQF